MSKQKSREELMGEVASLTASLETANTRIDELDSFDEENRNDITIALGLEEKVLIGASIGRGYMATPDVPVSRKPLTWSQIFMEIGRLREIKSRVSVVDFTQQFTQRAEAVLNDLERRAEEIRDEDRPRRGGY